MARFEVGKYAEVISTGRIGEVIDRKRTKVTVEFFDESCIDSEVLTFNDYQLKAVELTRMKTSQLKPFVRGEMTLSEITNGVNILPGFLDTDVKAYRINIDDLYSGIRAYECRENEDIYRWINTIFLFEDDIGFSTCSYEAIIDEVKEKDILAYAYGILDDFQFEILDEVPEDIIKKSLKELGDDLNRWVSSNGTEYPDSIKRQIAFQFDSDSIDKQSEKTQQLYKECLDYLCDEKKEPKAIQQRGYCIYCGTKVYPNDWIKARDAFIEYYNMTGDASAANTLGYIYYYGRCNGGVPQYEEAFKYFSIGHAFTYFESTYKLADMLAHGYGVVKDDKSANHLYWSVYEQCFKRFILGDTKNKFPDAALRMGNCYKDGIGVNKDFETAYFYYLQADFGIRDRIAKGSHYGDSVVYTGIQKAMAETRKEYIKKGRTEKFIYPGWTKWTLIDNRRCKLSIRELKDGVLSISARPIKRRIELHAPKMLITIPKADYCNLVDKINIKTSPGSQYSTFTETPEIIFDSIDYDWRKHKTTFYLYDDKVGELITEFFTFTAPQSKKIEPSGDKYHFASVRFQVTGRVYDYLCDDASVKAGDFVIVNGYDGENSVEVVEVFDKFESELGMPIERYKKILRKEG